MELNGLNDLDAVEVYQHSVPRTHPRNRCIQVEVRRVVWVHLSVPSRTRMWTVNALRGGR